ncbi:MAG: hypothetical protein QOF78_1757 [Phycisphaerales bacterium]|nr:hypothetical protein [Phycisphaerales bacterium]
MDLSRKTRSGKRNARFIAGVFVFLISSLFTVQLSPAQSTQPSQAPLQIKRWLEALTHPESGVRDNARIQLMNLTREQLGDLRETVDRMRPISPAQATVLHDVVIHIYVGGGGDDDRYSEAPPSGFLGVLLEPMQSGFGLGVAPGDDIQDLGEVAAGGVLIKETWPGFAGFQFLRVGDVVLGIGGARPPRAPNMTELKTAVSSTTPGRVLELQVLRQGRIIDVPVRVSARPAWAGERLATQQVQAHRIMRAERYWKFAFALLLLDDGMS